MDMVKLPIVSEIINGFFCAALKRHFGSSVRSMNYWILYKTHLTIFTYPDFLHSDLLFKPHIAIYQYNIAYCPYSCTYLFEYNARATAS